MQNSWEETFAHVPRTSRHLVQREGERTKNHLFDRDAPDERETDRDLPEMRSECTVPDRSRYTSELRERVHRQRLGRSTNDMQKAQVAELCSGRNATLTDWLRAQKTVSLSSAEADLNTLTTGLAEGMVTKHLLQELGHEVTLMNHVGSESAKACASRQGLGRLKHVMRKYILCKW